MDVPFLDLLSHNLRVEKETFNIVQKIVHSGNYIFGDTVDQFESELASYLNVSQVITCNSGYDALYLSLKALELRAEDEVIVPAHTFIATWLAVSNLGVRITPVDVEPGTGNIDCDKIEEKLTHNTKAIIAVHLYGRPAELDKLEIICKKNKIYLIEDAAQAIGAYYKGVKIGGHGDLTCWSFYPGKNLGGIGDGGAVSTNNLELANRIKLYANYGSKQKYIHQEMGINSRLNPINAGILRAKLSFLDNDQEKRRNIAKYYFENIQSDRYLLPKRDDSEYTSSWHLFVLRVTNRFDFQLYMKEKGIQTLIHYPIPCHQQEIYKKQYGNSHDLKISENWANTCISIPIGPQLSIEQLEYTTYTLNKY